jgi:hypothetical protein
MGAFYGGRSSLCKEGRLNMLPLCVHVSARAYMYVYAWNALIFMCLCVRIFLWICAGEYLCICVRVRIFMCKNAYLWAYMWHPLSAKVDINFADKRRPLGRYSSLADSSQGEKSMCACLFAYVCARAFWRLRILKRAYVSNYDVTVSLLALLQCQHN